MPENGISRSELLQHLNRILMVIRIRIEKGVAYHIIKDNVDLLESSLDMRRDVDWKEEKYLISYTRIREELNFIKDKYGY